MILFGMTGPIGHGKSTFAKALKQIEPSLERLESSLIIADVANALHASMQHVPKRDNLDSINNWLRPLPSILLEVVQAHTTFKDIELDLDSIERHPIEYDKLLLHIENLNRNPDLARGMITAENKEAYRPILQWLGGYLVRRVDSGIWYKEIIRRVNKAKTKGTAICVVGGVRFPNDAKLLRGAGGMIIKVYRPGHLQYDMLDPTERERENIKPDCTIISNGTIEDMNKTTKAILDDVKSGNLQKTYYTAPHKALEDLNQ